ncbi:MAG: hypothetical protein AB7O04_15045 [Hyphomonadaceae bacterium]
MIALAVFILIFGWSLIDASFRRALPLLASALTAWLLWRSGFDWIATGATAFAVLVAASALSDVIVSRTRLSGIWIACELVAAIIFGLVSAFAVFGSSGVHGATLVALMGAFALIAAVTTWRFRVLD